MYSMQGLRYVESKLLVPFYGKHSRVEVTLTGVDALGRETQLKTIRLEHGSKNNTGTNTPKQIVKDESIWNIEKQQVLTVLLDVGLRDVPQAVSTDKDHIYYRYSSMDNRDITNDAPFYKAAKLAVKYMPDTEMWPNFTITTQKGVE